VIVTIQEPRKEEVIEVVAPTTTAEGTAPAAEGAPGAEGAAPGAAAPADAKKEEKKK
jgi:hypothetical protein